MKIQIIASLENHTAHKIHKDILAEDKANPTNTTGLDWTVTD